jgi:hypothetical protein
MVNFKTAYSLFTSLHFHHLIQSKIQKLNLFYIKKTGDFCVRF